MERWVPREVVSAALEGSQPEIERLVAAIWPRCLRLAVTVIGDRALAQDAAQEACVIVYRKLRSLRNAEAFDAWVYRIVMREASRARGRQRSAGTQTYEECAGTDLTVAVDVWNALARLSPELREITVLFYFDDLRSEDIASILRIPHATVRTRLARARERLRTFLGDYIDEYESTSGEVKQHAF
jgi:RNA polymerase sigma-70 factor, ECF subfamily